MRGRFSVDFYHFSCTIQQNYAIMPRVTASESHRVKEIALMASKVRKYDMKRLRNQAYPPSIHSVSWFFSLLMHYFLTFDAISAISFTLCLSLYTNTRHEHIILLNCTRFYGVESLETVKT